MTDDLAPSEINEARWMAQGMVRRATWGKQVVSIVAPMHIPRGHVITISDDGEMAYPSIDNLTLLDPPAPR